MKKKKRLIYLPLGGANEIGMNMYIYGYGFPGAEEFIVVDVGITFPDMSTSPGVDVIMPDITFIKENKARLLGVFITHAHEDHIGALGHLIKSLNVPIYCRNFSARIALSKIDKAGYDDGDLKVVGIYPEIVSLGPFTVSFVPISHSIPEASSLVIDNPVGRIIHTGDFKLDRTPVLGDSFDPKLLVKLTKTKVLALVCDSTNVFSVNPGRSEASIAKNIINFIKSQKGVVVATTFASNVARLFTLATCAQAAGRSVLVLGRAMQAMISTTSSVGVLNNFPTTISVEDASNLPRSNLFILATGSQGEGRAASAQLSREKYLDVVLEEGDSFLFSSKTIPGNEVAVNKIINNFMTKGIDVFDDTNGLYHVSGHANRPDLITLHKLLNPKIVIPMHGEARHLREHKKLAESQGFNSIVVSNGSQLTINKDGGAKIESEIKTGKIFFDGGNLISADDDVVRNRLQMAVRGHLSISVLIENNIILDNGIWVKSKGLCSTNTNNAPEIDQIIEETLELEFLSIGNIDIFDDTLIEGVIKRVCNKVCQRIIGKKPVITSFINRLN